MWKMLNNGVCPPPPPKVFGFVTGDAGDGGMQMAIDNAGRVYAWGATSYGYSGQTPISITGTSNFWRHPDTYYETATPGNYHPATLKPIQVGTKSDFVKCRMGEDFYTALDSEGYLWGWGMPWSFGLGGWNDTAQYTGNGYPPTPFTPGGRHAITPQRLFDVVWKDFINGQYHMIAIKPDGSLWIWGKNLDGTTFGNNTYAEDYVSLVPIEMTWVPGPVKLVAAYWSVTAIVTESNQIWIWGEWWIAEW
jgi:alpha-tubulin suppressor-like RCC1 family protein